MALVLMLGGAFLLGVAVGAYVAGVDLVAEEPGVHCPHCRGEIVQEYSTEWGFFLHCATCRQCFPPLRETGKTPLAEGAS